MNASAPSGISRSKWQERGGATALVALTIAVYLRALPGEFLWDDDSHIYANPVIIGPLGLREIWTTTAANYFPLVLTNFWIQHALWGLNPFGYHLVTLSFHCLAMLVLWRVLIRMSIPGAWLGAALWGLHPVQVESVAWICELKNTQSAVFFLLSAWFFLRWLDARKNSTELPISVVPNFGVLPASSKVERVLRHYACALFCAVLALLSKPSTVMLPVALVLVWWWRERRLPSIRAAMWLVPFFALSGIMSAWTIWEQKFHSGAIGEDWNQSYPERVIIAGRAIWFYFEKLFWPAGLTFIYPRWAISAAKPLAYLPFILACVGLIWLWLRRLRFGGAWIAATFFVALLFPVLGFFNVYFFRYSFVGDHFQYLASIGPLVFFAAVMTQMLSRLGRLPGGVAVISLGTISAFLCGDYVSRETLWRSTVARNPSASMAWVHLGSLHAKAGRHDDAVACFQRAAQVNPRDYDAYNNLGCELMTSGRLAEALAQFQRALQLSPNNAEVLNNLGFALRGLGRTQEAIRYHEQALRLRPNFAAAHNNLGVALLDAGRPADALAHFEASLAKTPDPKTHHNVGVALRMLGRLPDAIVRYELALRLDPNLAGTHDDLGVALAESGRIDDAIRHYERAVELQPSLATARINLGLALARRGQLAEALAHFEEAVKSAPRYAPAELNRGNVLTGLGRWPEARDAFLRAVQLQPDSVEARRNLAKALANLGAPDQAEAQFEAALKLQPDSAETHAAFAQLLQAIGRSREAEEHRARAEALTR